MTEIHGALHISKVRGLKGREKIAMLTCYDYPFAVLMDGIVDLILVGDSLGMVVLGYENTLAVTMPDMLRATAAVARGAKKTLIVGDMPAGTYDTTENALHNAHLFLDAGAHCVKIEKKPEIAEFLCKNKIAVMGHTGLTPQTITNFKVQGKDEKAAEKILQEAKALQNAGCFSVVLECIPISLAKKITENLKIPTIGIGAGPYCDGQVLVMHDMLGLFDKFKPRFVKRYAEIGTQIQKAVGDYAKEVKDGKFPTEELGFR